MDKKTDCFEDDSEIVVETIDYEDNCDYIEIETIHYEDGSEIEIESIDYEDDCDYIEYDDMYSTIDKMTGVEFENLIKMLLERMGFDVQMTKASGDGGIDLIAYSNQPLVEGKYIIQCKRYSKSVGEPPVRDLYGVVMSEHANKGIFITNNRFTKNAIKFADGKPIELIDGTYLNKLLFEHDIMEDYSNDNIINYFDEGCVKCFNAISDADGLNDLSELRGKFGKLSMTNKTFLFQYQDIKEGEECNNSIFYNDIKYKEVGYNHEQLNGYYPSTQGNDIVVVNFIVKATNEELTFYFESANGNDILEQSTQTQYHNLKNQDKNTKEGCYIATAIYGSYEAPEVLTLRKFRDEFLKQYLFGRIFIKLYYIVSPKLVRQLKGKDMVNKFMKKMLDRVVRKLRK